MLVEMRQRGRQVGQQAGVLLAQRQGLVEVLVRLEIVRTVHVIHAQSVHHLEDRRIDRHSLLEESEGRFGLPALLASHSQVAEEVCVVRFPIHRDGEVLAGLVRCAEFTAEAPKPDTDCDVVSRFLDDVFVDRDCLRPASVSEFLCGARDVCHQRISGGYAHPGRPA